MKQTTKKKDGNYLKPKLVVYGDISAITKLTSGGSLLDSAFPRDLPIFS